MVIKSQLNQSLLLVVEVYLQETPFILLYDDFYSGDLIGWVEGVTLI